MDSEFVRRRNKNFEKVNTIKVMEHATKEVHRELVNNVVNTKLPTIVVKLTKDSQSLFLLDTGASVSIISKLTFTRAKELGLVYKHISRPVTICTVNGDVLKYSGCADISFRINNKRYTNSFFITSHLDGHELYTGILGTDFMLDHRTVVNLRDNCVELGEDQIKFYSREECDLKLSAVETLRLATKIQLEPREMKMALIKGKTDRDQTERLEIRVKRCKNKGIQIANTIVQNEGKTYVEIVNNTDTKVTLNKRAIIGYLPKRVENNEEIGVNSVVSVDKKREEEFDINQFKLDNLPQEMREKFKQLLYKNKTVFSTSFETLGGSDTIKPRITLKSNTVVNQRPLPIPWQLRQRVKDEILKMEQAGILERSQSLYASPLIIVPKKDPDKFRMVCDLKLVNRIAENDNYPLPRIMDILNALAGSKFFAKVDLHSAFHQVMLPPEQREIFAFASEWGNFHYTRLPFGFKNSSNIFQRVMDNCLHGLQDQKILPYVDDIVIAAESLEQLHDRIKIVFERLKEFNLTLSPDKVNF